MTLEVGQVWRKVSVRRVPIIREITAISYLYVTCKCSDYSHEIEFYRSSFLRWAKTAQLVKVDGDGKRT